MFVALVKLEKLLVCQGGYGIQRLRHAERAYYLKSG